MFRAKAKEVGAPITFAEDLDLPVPESDLQGPYQPKNLITISAALEVYRSLEGSLPLNDEQIAEGLLQVQKTTGLRGRWQIISEETGDHSAPGDLA
ncbi:hypothetical protein HZ996_05880 [Cryomorphaceae bacterium]|nr:hypothetical protein HZ996_05880 [Cryomorphaceae bacterium]